MASPNTSPYQSQYNPQAVSDAAKTSNSAVLPNGANTIYTNNINLEAAYPFPTTGQFTVQLATTTATGNANSNNINVVLQDSNTNTDGTANTAQWANITGLSVKTIASVNGFYPGTTWNVALPPGVRQFIRAQATGETGGGVSTDGTLTVKLLF
jgi:hypothetical protein